MCPLNVQQLLCRLFSVAGVVTILTFQSSEGFDCRHHNNHPFQHIRRRQEQKQPWQQEHFRPMQKLRRHALSKHRMVFDSGTGDGCGRSDSSSSNSVGEEALSLSSATTDDRSSNTEPNPSYPPPPPSFPLPSFASSTVEEVPAIQTPDAQIERRTSSIATDQTTTTTTASTATTTRTFFQSVRAEWPLPLQYWLRDSGMLRALADSAIVVAVPELIKKYGLEAVVLDYLRLSSSSGRLLPHLLVQLLQLSLERQVRQLHYFVVRSLFLPWKRRYNNKISKQQKRFKKSALPETTLSFEAVAVAASKTTAETTITTATTPTKTKFERVPYGRHEKQFVDWIELDEEEEEGEERGTPAFDIDYQEGTRNDGGGDVIVFVHGGAWGSGFPELYRLVAKPFLKNNHYRRRRSHDNENDEDCKNNNRRIKAVAIVGYRTYPDAAVDEQVSDVAQALQHVILKRAPNRRRKIRQQQHPGQQQQQPNVQNQKQQTELSHQHNQQHQHQTDQPRIILMGHSTGAHLGMLGLVRGDFSFPIERSRPHFGDKDDDANEQDGTVAFCCIDKFVGLSGVYDIPDHYRFERTRGVERISPLSRACGGDDYSTNATTVSGGAGTRVSSRERGTANEAPVFSPVSLLAAWKSMSPTRLLHKKKQKQRQQQQQQAGHNNNQQQIIAQCDILQNNIKSRCSADQDTARRYTNGKQQQLQQNAESPLRMPPSTASTSSSPFLQLPPILIVHGDCDSTVPFSSSVKLVDALLLRLQLKQKHPTDTRVGNNNNNDGDKGYVNTQNDISSINDTMISSNNCIGKLNNNDVVTSTRHLIRSKSDTRDDDINRGSSVSLSILQGVEHAETVLDLMFGEGNTMTEETVLRWLSSTQ